MAEHYSIHNRLNALLYANSLNILIADRFGEQGRRCNGCSFRPTASAAAAAGWSWDADAWGRDEPRDGRVHYYRQRAIVRRRGIVHCANLISPRLTPSQLTSFLLNWSVADAANWVASQPPRMVQPITAHSVQLKWGQLEWGQNRLGETDYMNNPFIMRWGVCFQRRACVRWGGEAPVRDWLPANRS